MCGRGHGAAASAHGAQILSFDYAGRYSYYNFGGITLELAAQTLRIGLLNFILIGMGLWFAAKRRLPALPCLAGAELLVSLVLFTRVQNTGSHQMLLFVPGWLLLFLVGSAALADGLKSTPPSSSATGALPWCLRCPCAARR